MGEFVTPEGLQIPTIEDELASLEAEQRANIDPNLDTDPESPIGEINGIVLSHQRELWEGLQVAYNGFNPDDAEDFLLDALSALTGTERAAATRSRFTGSRSLTVNLDATTTLPVGTVFHVAGDPETRFETTEEIISTTAGDYSVEAQCQELGPIHCNAGTLTEIATPVVGLNSVTNDFDARLGTNEDNNAELRTRREKELRATGSGTVDSLQADVFDIELDDESKPIQDCTVLQNDSDVTDGNGLPPHSLEVLVYDGVTQDCPNDVLVQTIWNSKPGGIQLYGSSSDIAIDSKGNNRTIYFTRVTIIDIKMNIDLTIDIKTYAGDATAKAKIKNQFLAKVRPSRVIRFQDYITALLRDCPGALQVTDIKLGKVGFAFLASWTNLSLGLREMGALDTSNITLTTTPGTP